MSFDIVFWMMTAVVSEMILIVKARGRNHFMYSIPIAIIAMMFNTFDTSDPNFIYILVIRFLINYIASIVTIRIIPKVMIRIANRMLEGTFTYVMLFSTIYCFLIVTLQYLIKSIILKFV